MKKLVVIALAVLVAFVGVAIGIVRDSSVSKDAESSPLYMTTLNRTFAGADAKVKVMPLAQNQERQQEPTRWPIVWTECPLFPRETRCPRGETHCPVEDTRCPVEDTSVQ
jgi:hypothetical protein